MGLRLRVRGLVRDLVELAVVGDFEGDNYSACFFFSSRRRHTRLQGDWSSDVCSSDLHRAGLTASHAITTPPAAVNTTPMPRSGCGCDPSTRASANTAPPTATPASASARSEERRVGKEGRSRWSPYH